MKNRRPPQGEGPPAGGQFDSCPMKHPIQSKSHGPSARFIAGLALPPSSSRKFLLSLLAGTAVALLPGGATAEVRLPAIFSEHMVLEKCGNVPVWGRANAGEEVSVTLNSQKKTTTAAGDGTWSVLLDLRDSPPGPFELMIEGENKIVIGDVVVGEVWVASGQSNMAWALKETTAAEREIAASENPMLREFRVSLNPSDEKAGDVRGRWVTASPATAGGFSAVGYYFAKRLQHELQRPVGLITTSAGGTQAEAWTSSEAIDSVPELRPTRDRRWAEQRDYPAKKEAFVKAMDAWVEATGREDQPAVDAAAFAGFDVSTEGWTPISLPGPVRGSGLPAAGVVWIRREVELSAEQAKLNQNLRLPLDGFDGIYWNGELIKQTSYKDFPGLGFVRSNGPFVIPAAKVKPGKNVIAIRLYQPVAPAIFHNDLRVGRTGISGEWLAKAEREFPAIAPEQNTAAPRPPVNPARPMDVASYLFNGMVAPLIPYAISGVIWYQGESNTGRSWQYRTVFPLLIKDWRNHWARGDFPFYFCQLANFKDKKAEPDESAWAELREAQSTALALPNTGQAVLIDLGESEDIHPRNKKEAGERLAAIALARDYGRDVPFSGPVFQSASFDSGRAVLRFDHTDGGLVAKPLPETFDVASEIRKTAPLVRNSPGSELEGFAVCGEDGKWFWAEARIKGDTVVVSSASVPSPTAVRYAWADNPTCNLYNGAGFPAAPFRTDDFPAKTLNAKY